MDVKPEEFVSARDMSRKFGILIDELTEKKLSKIVVMHRNKPKAVVLSIETYETLASTNRNANE